MPVLPVHQIKVWLLKTNVAAIVGALGLVGMLPVSAQTLTSINVGGAFFFNYNQVATNYNAGYSMNVALLGRPQYAYYASSPGNFSASLEPSTWMTPTPSPGIYCDIEGAVGYGGGYGNPWLNTGFGIGAVAGNGFTNFANGVSTGRNGGVYGAAQISPHLLFPPGMEMFRNGTSGQFVGYGYLALPLLPGKATTDGYNVPTGDHWWTLFFNTRNFQGPVAVLTPHFYSQVTIANTNAAGLMLDSGWAGPNKAIQNESHTVPAMEYDGPEGSYVRVEPVFGAINHGTNGSIVLNTPTVYDQTALWNAALQWFTNNGPAPVGPFNAQGAAVQTYSSGSWGWSVHNSPLSANPMAMSAPFSFYGADAATWGYRWGTNQVWFTQFANGTPAVAMPEYYKLQGSTWTPVSADTVPAQLATVSFDSGGPPAIPATYNVPTDSVWTNPGPAAGPFQARLDDGMVVTYYWYRFEEQPAIMKAGLTQAERDQLQAAVEKIHSAWTNGGSYLPSPTMGTIADVDPALLVTAPANLPAVGYVPVATSEAWGGWITNAWNQSVSGNWSAATNWLSAPADGGHSYYRLNFAPAGTYAVTNDLNNGYGYGGFAVNQLNFSGAVTLAGNPISLTADYGSSPQINQNSANPVVINTPLNLDVSSVLAGSGNGLVIISNVISGPWHSLTLNNIGTWRLCGLTPNTYSGGTFIKSGTLIWGAVTNGVSPDCSLALGTGPVTLNNGATLQFEHASPTNALILNGGTLYAANSAGANWLGPVACNANVTMRTDYGLGISGNISGTGGLTKTGTDTLTLSGVNTYTGTNVVQAGTLFCASADALSGGALAISNGAVVNLNYSGTRTIFSLNLGATNQLAGVYGSASSPAAHQDAHFSGTGTVTVTVPVSIYSLPATVIKTNQAALNANLSLSLAYGGTNATVLAYWGTADGGTNPAAWSNSANAGTWSNVSSKNLAYTATGLTPNTTYYFTFRATNAFYSVWSTNVLTFTTPQPPTQLAFAAAPSFSPPGFSFSVTVQAQDASGKPQPVLQDTTVQLSKNTGAGTVSGTVTGTILTGNSSVVIPGVSYSVADTMTLSAASISGMGLTPAVSPPITFVADLTWDANGSTTGASDGSGSWINSSNTWWTGTTNINWAADNFNARIGSGGAGGTILLGTVNANLVTFTNFSGTYTLTNGSLTVASNLSVANSAGNVVLGALITGPGQVIMNGSGSLSELVPNAYAGGTVATNGTLIFGSMYAFGTGPVMLAGGVTIKKVIEEGNVATLATTNSIHLNGGYVNAVVAFSGSKDLWFSGPISGPGGIALSGDRRALTLTGNNSFSGGVVIQESNCRLALGHTNALGTGLLTSQNSTAGSGRLQTTADLSGGAGVTNAINIFPGAYLNVNNANNLRLSGPITNGGNLFMNGSAVLTLSGTNTYTGSTTVAAGTLSCSQPVSLGAGALIVSNGAVVNLNYTNRTAYVASLTLGGTNMVPGVYGSANSPAEHQDSHFTGAGTITVPAPPTANFSGTPTNGYAPLQVVFTDVSSGTITNRHWIFGDGNVLDTASQTLVTNLYLNPGVYGVTLIVSGAGGAATNYRSAYINVASVPAPIFSGGSALTMNSGGSVAVAVNSMAGVKYRLLLKNNLQATNTWTVVTPPLPNGWTNGTGTVLWLTDPTSAGVGQRFYRVEAESVSAP